MAKSSRMDSFQLKADFLPITTLKLLRHETDSLQRQLEYTIQKAPQYFTNAPILVDFSSIPDAEQLNLKEICSLLRQYQMQPIAARGIQTQDFLPVLSDLPQKPVSTKSKSKETEKPITKILTKPVRAGTQVYAKDSDLIILASVNAGAEVIADGNIHIYAPLRGRALAGANGNTDARIFCKQLEAELVAIAGHYLVSDKIKMHDWRNNFVQIYLVDDELKIELL